MENYKMNKMPEKLNLFPAILLKNNGLIKVGNSLKITNKILDEYSKRQLAPKIKTVIIGTQEWMTENLNVECFRNGDIVPEAKTNEDWVDAGINSRPAWCYYEFSHINERKYGKLFNGFAVIDSRGLAPLGWHIPSDLEWQSIFDTLGGESTTEAIMKAINGLMEKFNGPISSGFNGLSGPICSNDGEFIYDEGVAVWWSSSIFSNDFLFYVSISGRNSEIISMAPLTFGVSIRCLKSLPNEDTINNFNISLKSVFVGIQEWMTSNLSVECFRNGDFIQETKSDDDWIKAFNDKKPAWCYFENDPLNGVKYGKLYNSYAVNDPRGLAPEGWHIPNDKEWSILINLLGGVNIASKKMKSTLGWSFFIGKNEMNPSGLEFLPGGSRSKSHFSDDIGESGYWWSSDEESSYVNWLHSNTYITLNSFNDDTVEWGKGLLGYGYSVRCLRD